MDSASTIPTLSSDSSSVASTDQIVFSETDRSRLQTFVHSGQQSARARARAQILLKPGESWSQAEVRHAFDVCRNTIESAPRSGRAGDWQQCEE